MAMKMRGFLIVLFGFPLCVNVGLTRGLVPGIQLVIGMWTLLWHGGEPTVPHTGRITPVNMPMFMIALTTTTLTGTDDKSEGDLRASGFAMGVDDERHPDDQ